MEEERVEDLDMEFLRDISCGCWGAKMCSRFCERFFARVHSSDSSTKGRIFVSFVGSEVLRNGVVSALPTFDLQLFVAFGLVPKNELTPACPVMF
jgi:hypothetical protein